MGGFINIFVFILTIDFYHKKLNNLIEAKFWCLNSILVCEIDFEKSKVEFKNSLFLLDFSDVLLFQQLSCILHSRISNVFTA